MSNSSNITSESLLYLTENQLRQGIEAMFFAYRGFTADPDRILDEYGYCLLYTSPSPRDYAASRMPSSA